MSEASVLVNAAAGVLVGAVWLTVHGIRERRRALNVWKQNARHRR